jgi:hypothetical protein
MMYGSGRHGSPQNKHAMQRGTQYRDVELHRALTEPSKAELRTMLAEAARNTAAQQINKESRDGTT